MTEIVTVDGGASRCRLAAYADSGERQAQVVVEAHASLSLGVDEAWLHIERGLQQLANELGKPMHWRPRLLSMGLAGSLQQSRRQAFLALIPANVQVILNTDGYAQLLGATDAQPGICLAVGTGSVMHWLDEQGRTGMAGGWGFPAADQGSGAWLGMQLLRLYVEHRDGRQCDSLMVSELERRVGTSVSAIQQWTTQTRSCELARLAPLIFDAAAAGDRIAHALLDDAVEECLRLVSLAPSYLPVFVVGGIGEQLLIPLGARLGTRLHAANGDALLGLWHIVQASGPFTGQHTSNYGDNP